MTQQEIDTRVSQAEVLPISIKIAKMPLIAGAHGITTKDASGNCMVIINADLSDDEQEAAFIHEMLHIWHNDFTAPETAGQIEHARHTTPHRRTPCDQ